LLILLSDCVERAGVSNPDLQHRAIALFGDVRSSSTLMTTLVMHRTMTMPLFDITGAVELCR
jgi:hypothetical protein